ncbi:MAG: CAP domain-containing protein, partial [Ruminococcus sp.]|nr:CAP domain-containing protein [Ruminococcus sp.]
MAYTEYPEKAEELGKLINTERTARGLKPLYCVPHLNKCAMIRASEASVYWSHTRPDGRNWSSVIDLDIVDLAHYSENLAAGSETAEAALNQWRNSQNHWNAIISEYYTHIGIGIIYNPNGVNGVQWFWCTIFTSDFRGDDYKYEGQYLPGEYGGGTTEISCIDTETGRNITKISINIYSRDTEKRDLSGVRITQNDSSIDYEISSDKSNIWFTTGSYPSTVSKIPTGTYYVEIRNAPNGYYSDFLNTSSYYYTYFTIKTDGTSDKDNITLNL